MEVLKVLTSFGQLPELSVHLSVQKLSLLSLSQVLPLQHIYAQQWERFACDSPARCLESGERKAGRVGTGAAKLTVRCCQGIKKSNNFCWQEQGWGGCC